ncbi:tetratricopeptide repeat protein [Flavobacteriaceae bacterium]|nr:tetratricopeptide repeat protein [Flavobacteriaceae bacterium]
MKKQVLFVAAALIGLGAMAQKKELKTAEKALKKGDLTATTAALDMAEPLLEQAGDDKLTAKYMYLRSQVIYGDGMDAVKNKEAGEAFVELIDYEEERGMSTYSELVVDKLNALISDASNSASEAYQEENFKKAAQEYYHVYTLSPKDTSFLENAGLASYFAKEYKNSIKYFQLLLDIGYTGIYTEYKAKSTSDGSMQRFASKKDMESQVKFGLVEDPQEVPHPSRVPGIVKNIAFNYIALDENEKALEIFKAEREKDPNNYDLVINEANVYFRMGDTAKFKELLELAVSIKPDDPNLHYNIGVMNMETGEVDASMENFKKAIELKPDYIDAYINLGAATLKKAEPIVEEMNKNLSNFDKYDALQLKQLEFYREAIPYFEKAFDLDQGNISVAQTLSGIYEQLEMYDKQKEIQEKIAQLQQ